ncbi:MAG: DUF3575 domain-containing protein [Bacteroidales bacterium]|nr:DUF3575 domain-containing protein [Bacteroidales bacterium]
MVSQKFCLCLITGLLMGLLIPAKAQDLAVKTNLVYDATATVNLGAEIGLAPKWTLDLSGNLNAWSKNDQTKWKHWMVQPEARYWFCDRFSRHFVGMHLIGGIFNFGNIDNDLSFPGIDFSVLSDKRYQGYAYGCGVAYGFAFALSRHLNLELEAGLGYVCLDYETFECDGCGRKVADDIKHYVGPTKAALNLVYVF